MSKFRPGGDISIARFSEGGRGVRSFFQSVQTYGKEEEVGETSKGMGEVEEEEEEELLKSPRAKFTTKTTFLNVLAFSIFSV